MTKLVQVLWKAESMMKLDRQEIHWETSPYRIQAREQEQVGRLGDRLLGAVKGERKEAEWDGRGSD